MANILIYNNQSFGDALIGTHLVRVIKQKLPSSRIIFAIPESMNLTTCKNQQEGLIEIKEILELQYGIDKVISSNTVNEQLDIIIEQKEWWSDLGIVKSALTHPLFYTKDIDTNLRFNVGEEKILYKELTICTPGPLEWERKLHNTNLYNEVMQEIQKFAKVIPLDVNTHKGTYLDALKIANKCHLTIGPMGSFVLASAGLGLDTISISSIFPAKYDSPEFYMTTGTHYTISPEPNKYCKNYMCITKKEFTPFNYNKEWGNPRVRLPEGFWPTNCPYRKSKKPCISYYKSEQILKKFRKWYDSRI